jgi:Flp pilus assembly protein TadG
MSRQWGAPHASGARDTLGPRRRSRSAGQGLVEFAFAAPVFLIVLFMIIDGGVFLYSMNGVNNAATKGSNSVAALGARSDADTTSLALMITQGFGNNGLITATEVDVAKLEPNATNGFATNPDGSPKVYVDATNCGGAPSQCINRYTVSNPGGGPTVTAIGSVLWSPSTRNVKNGSSDFVELVVKYSYRHLIGPLPNFNLTATKTFRLEPQQ